jgi:RND superfamily putative drug exporter
MVSAPFRTFVTRRPGAVVGLWLVLAASVGLLAPDLTRLAAEGQARVLPEDVESRRAAEVVARAWPEQSYGSLAVAALYRPEGLTEADRAYAGKLAAAFEGPSRPREVLRVLGPNSEAEVAERLVSRDGTLALVALPLAKPFVSPTTHEAVDRLQAIPGAPGLAPPAGLRLSWTGDAVLGRDYMGGVKTSLDRAAVATVVLLLAVLLAVYRSLWLSLVPLVTIGVSLVISRGLLSWLNLAGWEVSSLVELFLVAVLFGSGTDFCLFVSWRFAEAWDPDDPAGAMDRTLRRSALALLTSAGTVVVGLLLMGTTRFKLFSCTGPSVALGLVLSLAATLTLTPALLVLLARFRPKAFRGLTAPSSGFWDRLGSAAMARPLQSWLRALLVMAPLALLGLRSNVVQDLMTELPSATPSAQAFRLVASRFEPGVISPLSVVLESETDLRGSEGLALIDDLSRYLARHRDLAEVRSATQPLGTPETLGRARITSRLAEIENGFGQLAAGAGELRKGLSEGALKLRAAIWFEGKTGLSLTGARPAGPKGAASRGTGALSPWASAERSEPAAKGDDPRARQVDDLLRAAEGAGLIAEGAGRARRELATVLNDPVGRRALDRLLIDAGTVADHPEIRRSFDVYLTPDGRRARIDLAQADRVFSAGAMDGVETLRRRVKEFLDSADGPRVTATIAGANADSADVRALTRSDQFRSWFIIPAGVFLVLLVSLRDSVACLNLVATMLLTYAFALGATYLVFVAGLGAEGLDWKVPYFLFVLLVAVGVDYNVFLMARLNEEADAWGLRQGIVRAIGQTGGLITSAAAITACSFASFLSSPLGSLRQLGFALVVGITVDALLVRPLLVPCGHWLLSRLRERRAAIEEAGSPNEIPLPALSAPPRPARLAGVAE